MGFTEQETEYWKGIICNKGGCDKYHHILLHSVKMAKYIMHTKCPEEEKKRSTNMESFTTWKMARATIKLSLPTLIVEIAKFKKPFACLDRSYYSCIHADLAKSLEAEPLAKMGKQYIKYIECKKKLTCRLGPSKT